MTSRRTEKFARAILEVVSSAILFEIKDPRVKNVTVIRVEVSPDLRSTKIYVSVMGDDKTQQLCMHGLNSARGFLQHKIADRLQTKYTPVCRFILDSSIKKSFEATRIINETLKKDGLLPVDQIEIDPTNADQIDMEEDDEMNTESEHPTNTHE